MIAFVSTIAIGVLICVLGIINMTGNISSLHSYHRHRVSEEDRKPFGKLVGLGTLIIGLGCIAFGVLSLIGEKSGQELFVLLGTGVLLVGIIVGLILSFYAMNKYNHGIF